MMQMEALTHPIPSQGLPKGLIVALGYILGVWCLLLPHQIQNLFFFFNHALLNLAGSYRGHTLLKKSQKTSIGLNFNSAVTRYMTFNISSPPETGSSSVLRR